ncbi:MAG TPA: hypothetical protein VFY73_01500 [Ideonella sp.]|uniref:hypothetical protein n=1 Tax=Ideonella sp. TaxID=1929293 RepID=UPI002E2F876E|nr:hypothetical protein [Ideonella sp.]HEX5682683.1 hypothetical protein [Ideonella sp.]
MIATQSIWLRTTGLPERGLLSALVAGFELSLQVRTDNLRMQPLLAVAAISSQSVWRYEFVPGRPSAGSAHRFPANLCGAAAEPPRRPRETLARLPLAACGPQARAAPPPSSGVRGSGPAGPLREPPSEAARRSGRGDSISAPR